MLHKATATFTTGRKCRRGHDAPRYRSSYTCTQCHAEREARRSQVSAANKLSNRNYSRAYRERNRERLHERKTVRSRSVDGRLERIFNGAQQRAKAKGIDFSISREWLRSRIELGRCELTGIEFSYIDGLKRCAKQPLAPSLDRIESNKGYTPDNCRVVLWALNCAINSWGSAVYERIAVAYLKKSGLI
jgi:hypothetical protein